MGLFQSRTQVEEEVAALGDLTLADLRERWRGLFGRPPPKSLRRAFLIKACAYQIQVKAFGGLSKATRRRLRAIAEAVRTGDPIPAASPKIRSGTRFVRSWGGEVHTVTAIESAFEYRGQRFRSLSAIAKEITGTNWNGLVFFGVKQAAKGNATAPTRNGDGDERGAVSGIDTARPGDAPTALNPRRNLLQAEPIDV